MLCVEQAAGSSQVHVPRRPTPTESSNASMHSCALGVSKYGLFWALRENGWESETNAGIASVVVALGYFFCSLTTTSSPIQGAVNSRQSPAVTSAPFRD